MKQKMVHCQCGQRVKTPDVLRTDYYERPSGKDYVYVKYRCRRCKQIGEAFVPERTFRWSMFDSPHDEMTDKERETFADKEAVSSVDVLDLHQFLKNETALSFAELKQSLQPKTDGMIADDKNGNTRAAKAHDDFKDK